MCLITEQKKPIKTRKNLTVYKILRTVTNDSFKPWSYDFDYLYKLGVLNEEVMKFDNNFISYLDKIACDAYNPNGNIKLTHVHEGFHAFINRKRMFYFNTHEGEVIVKCLIPSGSLIFKDKTGLIVSNQIIIKEVVK